MKRLISSLLILVCFTSLSFAQQMTEQKGTDLIVIHTHGRTGIKRLILGSVTEKIVNHASCTVLALRPD